MANDGASSNPQPSLICKSRAQWPSCWRVIPVVLVLGYRLFIYGSIIFINPSTVLRPRITDCFVWAVATITVIFYLRTSCVDPGFQDWCPSEFLRAEEKKRANDVKARILKSGVGQQKSASSSDSSFSGGSIDLDEKRGQRDSDIEASDMEDCAIDLGADVVDAGSGGMRILQSGPGDAIVALDVMPQRKMRRVHTDAAGKTVTAPADTIYDSLELGMETDAKDKSTLTPKGLRWGNLSLAIVFTFRRVVQSTREWLLVWLAPYWNLFRARPKMVAPALADDGCRDAFSMGVHVMFQYQEKLQFCDKCKIWKPLRTKHCRSCERCVRLHDHHCPWLGVCVGERNRVHFLWYLGWQTVELLGGIGEIVWSVLINDTRWMDDAKRPDAAVRDVLLRIVLLVMIMVLGCLAIMTFCLFLYHLYLVGTNLTTWEVMSWHKITYLKSKKKFQGSPFGCQTCKANCILALLPFLTYYKKGARLLRVDPVDKVFPSRIGLGPDNAIIWKIKELGDPDYGKAPSCLRLPCCDLNEVCL